ncbi:MAG: sugar ABC transporter permease [Ruminococcaceae bacterium]|nr:sugar ABC transporter permease [Oscillospiraceae bacterium]
MRKINNFLNRHSAAFMLAPYAILFLLFIVIPVLAAIFLSFTDFNSVQFPSWVGFDNYSQLFTNDSIFMQKVLPNTITFAVFVGVGGYVMAFFLAWCLSQITKGPRTLLAIIIYSPSMTGGVLIQTVWSVIFNGDKAGYLNYILMKMDFIEEPIAWLQSEDYLLVIMIIVSLWSSMGVGFLAMLSGILNVNEELYEAGYIDGIKNRFQEIIYITIPAAKPQMLFGAIMAIVNTFQTGNIGVTLSGSNPTPNSAGQLVVTHIEDYGYLRFEMGYAAAISVVLLVGIYMLSKGTEKALSSKGE